MNTSYGVGAKFQMAIEDGKTLTEAMKEETVNNAMDDEVFYGNIVTVPVYGVGDVAHHIS